MGLAEGARLGTYEILRLIGAGGMGEVYEARDTRLNRRVALKVLPPDVARDPARLQRLHQEARTVAALNHPNIVTLHALEEAGGITFLVMELVAGRPLAQSIDRHGLPVHRILEIAAGIADALAAAHAGGVVHRDLKPANVVLTRDGTVKVLDFGLAKPLVPAPAVTSEGATMTAAPPLTAEHHVVGTVPYMAPEQIRGDRVDARTDIFAFGATLYEMASGARAFSGATSADVMSAVLAHDPQPLDSLRPDLPSRLVQLVERCMQKDPQARVQSAVDLSHDLRDILADVRARRAASPVPRRRRALLVTAAVIVLAGAAILLAPRLREPAGRAPGPIAIRSIAVLPFENLSRDPSHDYFVDGIHDALILELAKLGAFRVTSRSSVMRFRKPASVKSVARELGVDAIIEGTVLRDGNNIRVTAQLIRGDTDEHVWADRYNRDLANVLALLDEVSRAIASEVQRAAGAKASTSAVSPAVATVRPEAYDLYLRSQQQLRERGTSALPDAHQGFERVVQLDPGFARGWSALASASFMLGFFELRPVAEMLPAARAAAQKAMALDERDGLALAVAGTITLYYDWKFAEARALLEHAVALEPHSLMSRHAYADYLLAAGRVEESLEQVRLGRAAAPSAPMAHLILVAHLKFAGHHDEAITEGRQLLATSPDMRAIRELLAETLWHQGKYDDALDEYRQVHGASDPLVGVLERTLRTSTPRAAIRAYADAVASAKPPRGAALVALAGLYAEAGDGTSAMEWLDKAFGERVPQLLHVIGDPAFDGLRTDPRYVAMLQRIGAPAARDVR